MSNKTVERYLPQISSIHSKQIYFISYSETKVIFYLTTILFSEMSLNMLTNPKFCINRSTLVMNNHFFYRLEKKKLKYLYILENHYLKSINICLHIMFVYGLPNSVQKRQNAFRNIFFYYLTLGI